MDRIEQGLERVNRRLDRIEREIDEVEAIQSQLGYSLHDAPEHLMAQGVCWVPREPCGCYACDESTQPGHFACMTPPGELLVAERRGVISRLYTDGSWVWIVV